MNNALQPNLHTFWRIFPCEKALCWLCDTEKKQSKTPWLYIFVPVCLSKLLSANCFHKSIGIACGFKYCCLTVKQCDDKCFIFLISETVPQHVFCSCVNIFILKGRALWSLHQLSDSATQLPDNCSKQIPNLKLVLLFQWITKRQMRRIFL